MLAEHPGSECFGLWLEDAAGAVLDWESMRIGDPNWISAVGFHDQMREYLSREIIRLNGRHGVKEPQDMHN